jgi:hypothetical protein
VDPCRAIIRRKPPPKGQGPASIAHKIQYTELAVEAAAIRSHSGCHSLGDTTQPSMMLPCQVLVTRAIGCPRHGPVVADSGELASLTTMVARQQYIRPLCGRSSGEDDDGLERVNPISLVFGPSPALSSLILAVC